MASQSVRGLRTGGWTGDGMVNLGGLTPRLSLPRHPGVAADVPGSNGHAESAGVDDVPPLKPLGRKLRVSMSAGSLSDLLGAQRDAQGGVQTEGVATAVEEEGGEHGHDGLPPIHSRRSSNEFTSPSAPVMFFPELMTPAVNVAVRGGAGAGAGAGAAAGAGPGGGAGGGIDGVLSGVASSRRRRGWSRVSELSAAAPASVQPFFKQHRGGLRAVLVEGPGVYYMGTCVFCRAAGRAAGRCW